MKKETFVYSSLLDHPAEDVYRWHTRPGAFERLIPPWVEVRLLRAVPRLEDGARVEMEIRKGPVKLAWIAELSDVQHGREFSDLQVEGPFSYWKHVHRFLPREGGKCLLEDRVTCAPVLGRAGMLLGGKMLRENLDRLFAWRHMQTAHDLRLHHGLAGAGRKLQIAVSGGSGLIGSRLIALLGSGGHETLRLVRPPSGNSEEGISYDPERGSINAAGLEGVDAVVHLAGENIAGGRWSDERKERIRSSRVETTRLLSRALCRLENPPAVFVCASATGFYGDRGEEILDEQSAPGRGFLASVCGEWETAAHECESRGIRVANTRFGMVLSPSGGALRAMLPVFKAGLGGKLGDGGQYLPWIAIDDAVRALLYIVLTKELSGPVNIVAPNPLTNRSFTRALARSLGRPAFLGVPSLVLRTALGPMADELLLASCRAAPRKLLVKGYEFAFPQAREALSCMLGKARCGSGNEAGEQAFRERRQC